METAAPIATVLLADNWYLQSRNTSMLSDHCFIARWFTKYSPAVKGVGAVGWPSRPWEVHFSIDCPNNFVYKKVPTFKLSVTLSNLNRFSKFVHCWKVYEICYETHTHYPPHLRRVATLPWEIKNSSFLQIFSKSERKFKHIAFLIAFNFVIYPQISIFSAFKIASLSPYSLQI